MLGLVKLSKRRDWMGEEREIWRRDAEAMRWGMPIAEMLHCARALSSKRHTRERGRGRGRPCTARNGRQTRQRRVLSQKMSMSSREDSQPSLRQGNGPGTAGIVGPQTTHAPAFARRRTEARVSMHQHPLLVFRRGSYGVAKASEGSISERECCAWWKDS